MKRSFQEVVELVVFGLIALLIGVGVLWLLGWVLGLVGLLMKFLAGLIWWLLRYIVPIAIVAGLIYFLVRVLQGDRSSKTVPATPSGTGTAPAPTAPAVDTEPGSASETAAAPGDAEAARRDVTKAPAEQGEAGERAGRPAGDAGHDAPEHDAPEDDAPEDDAPEDDRKHN